MFLRQRLLMKAWRKAQRRAPLPLRTFLKRKASGARNRRVHSVSETRYTRTSWVMQTRGPLERSYNGPTSLPYRANRVRLLTALTAFPCFISPLYSPRASSDCAGRRSSFRAAPCALGPAFRSYLDELRAREKGGTRPPSRPSRALVRPPDREFNVLEQEPGYAGEYRTSYARGRTQCAAVDPF